VKIYPEDKAIIPLLIVVLLADAWLARLWWTTRGKQGDEWLAESA